MEQKSKTFGWRSANSSLRESALSRLTKECSDRLNAVGTIFEVEADLGRFPMQVFKAIIYAHRLGCTPLGIARAVADAYEIFLRARQPSN